MMDMPSWTRRSRCGLEPEERAIREVFAGRTARERAARLLDVYGRWRPEPAWFPDHWWRPCVAASSANRAGQDPSREAAIPKGMAASGY